MKRLLLILPLLLTPAAQALDYVRCEAMNKMYTRVDASLTKALTEATTAFEKENGSIPPKDKDPEGYARFMSLMNEAGNYYARKLLEIRADYEAECDF